MFFVDSHCHIHSDDYTLDAEEVLERSTADGVTKLICVGTDEIDSARAVDFAKNHVNAWASIGLHPHDAKLGQDAFDALEQLVIKPKVVAIGECGLDYFYNHSSKEDQERALRFQIELGLAHNIPMIFHVREAFEDFWPIFDAYTGVRGVVHSFTATTDDLEQILKRDLYVGINGIMTFSKNQDQLQAAAAIPLEKLLLETDAPFLTPAPLRGKVNEPKNVVLTAEFMSKIKGVSLQEIAFASTHNATTVFNLV